MTWREVGVRCGTCGATTEDTVPPECAMPGRTCVTWCHTCDRNTEGEVVWA